MTALQFCAVVAGLALLAGFVIEAIPYLGGWRAQKGVK